MVREDETRRVEAESRRERTRKWEPRREETKKQRRSKTDERERERESRKRGAVKPGLHETPPAPDRHIFRWREEEEEEERGAECAGAGTLALVGARRDRLADR